MKTILSFAFILGIFTSSFGQISYVSVLNEKLTVNSITNVTARYRRNAAEFSLPVGTIGFIYRISVFQAGKVNMTNQLTDLVKNLPIQDVRYKIAAQVGSYALQGANNESIDYFIFQNQADKTQFLKDGIEGINTCSSHAQRNNVAKYSDDCIQKKMYLGFQNKNLSQGLDVQLEVVAVVEKREVGVKFIPKIPAFSTFSIKSNCGLLTRIEISKDGETWNEYTLESNQSTTFRSVGNKSFIRISTLLGRDFLLEKQAVSSGNYALIFDKKNEKWTLAKALGKNEGSLPKD